jgi:hypothetical protein
MALNPRLWASLVPRLPGHPKPNHYWEMVRAAWQNRDQLPYAWRILTKGVCDGCALGTSGLRDWTLEGVHLCMVRLELMRLNTQPALDPARLSDVKPLRALDSRAPSPASAVPYSNKADSRTPNKHCARPRKSPRNPSPPTARNSPPPTPPSAAPC